jgi:hypothetical protein
LVLTSCTACSSSIDAALNLFAPLAEGLQPEPMESFMDEMKERPGATVSDIGHERKAGTEIPSFALTGPEGGYYFRMGRANSIQYMQVIQFPEAAHGPASEMKEAFFGSFRLTRP